MKHIFKLTVFTVILSMSAGPVPISAQANWETRDIIFPVIGAVTYWDDFGASRDGGARQHEGQDLMGARKMTPLVAAVDGTVSVSYPQESWGYSVTIRDEDGYSYHYLHINNDTPGTDDGLGGGMNAYAVDIDDGARVVAGQLIGYMGDSGNAESTSPHLHFEIRRPDRTPISPYNSLNAAQKISAPVDRPQQPGEILPFGNFEGGSFIAMGDVDGSSGAEIVIGAAAGGGPHVRVTDQDGDAISEFFPYDPAFRGGVDVATGDIDGDGEAEIITAPSSRGGSHIKVYGGDGKVISEFFAYDPSYGGGVNLAAADIDDDGEAEIITAPARNGGPHVRAFEADGTPVADFFAYDENFTGGIDVAAYTDDDEVYIATAPNTGGGPHVRVFDQDGDLRSEFLAYDQAHRGGVRLALAGTSSRRSSTVRIYTVPLLGGPQIKSFDQDGDPQATGWGFEEWWSGSWDVAAFGGAAFMSSNAGTHRRASVREAEFRGSSDDDSWSDWRERRRRD